MGSVISTIFDILCVILEHTMIYATWNMLPTEKQDMRRSIIPWDNCTSSRTTTSTNTRSCSPPWCLAGTLINKNHHTTLVWDSAIWSWHQNSIENIFTKERSRLKPLSVHLGKVSTTETEGKTASKTPPKRPPWYPLLLLYEFRGVHGEGDNLDKVAQNLEQRMRWIWEWDVKELAEALKSPH